MIDQVLLIMKLERFFGFQWIILIFLLDMILDNKEYFLGEHGECLL